MNLIAATVQAATGCTPTLAALYAPHLADACVACGITTPQRLAAFLAQIGHESGSLKYAAELWGPTPAQARYEGRADLGNVQAGDGQRFKGRGLIQVTGRFNYQRMRDKLRAKLGDQQVPDFETVPEALERPAWAAWSAAQFWSAHGCNELADSGDFEALTRRINGGVNGLADRMARWELAKLALDAPDLPTLADRQPIGPTPSPEPIEAPAPAIAVEPTKGWTMAPIIAALLPSLISAIPKLGSLFGSGSEVAQRNVKAAEIAFSVAKDALGATNEQEVVTKLQTDPAAVATVAKAIEDVWYTLTEAGGGGIDGARKADAAAAAAGDMLHSPSFWVTLALIPLVYMVVGSVVGLWGAQWPSDVRAAIATAVVSLIVGGAAGYYWGQTTTRNRTPS